MDYVRIRSQDDSDLFGALGLVLQSFKQMNEGGIYSIGQAYSFVRPRDLIKRAIHEVGELTVKFAKNQRWADSDYFLFYRVDPTAEDRVGIRLAAPLEVSSLVGGRSSFSNYVKSRLIR